MKLQPLILQPRALAALLVTAGLASPTFAGGDLSREQMEEQGLDLPGTSAVHAPIQKSVLAASGTVLLIPDSTSDTVAMFDPFDGTPLGTLINGAGLFSTPINAILGPDGNIYVSDQIADSVFVFDIGGTYLYTYADSTDGLNNIRGIDFRGNNLFVTSGDDYVAEFAGPHNRLADFIPVSAAVDSFDILFLADGSCLVADIQGTSDNISQFKADGTLDHLIFSVNFPEQVSADILTPGDFLTAGFTDKWVTHHDLLTANSTTPLASSGRGVYRLGNGNLLAANSNGLFELQPGTGTVINTIATGTGWRFIEEVALSAWTDLGSSLPGALGAPVLTGDGALVGGNQVTITLSNAAVNSTAYLIIGVTNISTQFYGGTLIPSPNLVISVPTGPSGGLAIPTIYPMGVLAGVPIYMQYWIQDPTGPVGLTASNAITATTE